MRPLLSEADLLILRSRLPNLAGISDQFLQTTSLADLTALNGLNPVAQAAPSAPSPSDHGRIMSASLAALTATPTMLPAGIDDRLQNLHPARFLAGPACDAGQLWLAAKAAIGPTGLIPIASYDMEKIGLSGCVTARGWFELHDPASTSLSLKLFSSANVGNSTSSNKRLTLADTDGVINVGDSMQEIADMADFQTALRAVSKAASFAIPWNHSFNAIEGFLHASNFCAAELANRPNRAALLTAFVNHVFGINAKKWSSGMVFLGADDLRSCWLAFFGTRSASVLTASGSGSGNRSGSGSVQCPVQTRPPRYIPLVTLYQFGSRTGPYILCCLYLSLCLCEMKFFLNTISVFPSTIFFCFRYSPQPHGPTALASARRLASSPCRGPTACPPSDRPPGPQEPGSSPPP